MMDGTAKPRCKRRTLVGFTHMSYLEIDAASFPFGGRPPAGPNDGYTLLNDGYTLLNDGKTLLKDG